MSYSIKVSVSPELQQVEPIPFFVKNFDLSEEFQTVMNLCDNKRRIDLFESLIIPIRTDTFNNFCKDFFLPTLINHALKFNHIALKIIYSVVLTICDICTFPIRVFTIIPRYLYNAAHPKEAHPFYQYLISNGVLVEDLSTDHVYLELAWTEPRGVFGQQGERSLATHRGTFNFIQLPITVSNIEDDFEQQDLPDQQQQLVIEEIF